MDSLAQVFYLVATALFVFGVKDLAKVRTARRGNSLAAMGMLVAVITTVADPGAGIDLDWKFVLSGLALGAVAGGILARTVAMTGMPEMVALFNGFGGAASLLVALSVFVGEYMTGQALGHVSQPKVDHFGCEKCSGCGPISSFVVSFGCHLTDKFCAHVLEGILHFDFLCDGDSVFGHLRSSKGFFKNDIASSGTESHSNGF